MTLLEKYHEFNSGLSELEFTQAEWMVFTLLSDCTDRRGWRQEWDQFDDDVKEEIINTWLEKTNGNLQ